MARGRVQANWEPMTWLLALTINLNRDPKKTPPASPDQFGPQRRRDKTPTREKGRITDLKIFLPEQKKKKRKNNG